VTNPSSSSSAVRSEIRRRPRFTQVHATAASAVAGGIGGTTP
jgi:hypothetical protein